MPSRTTAPAPVPAEVQANYQFEGSIAAPPPNAEAPHRPFSIMARRDAGEAPAQASAAQIVELLTAWREGLASGEYPKLYDAPDAPRRSAASRSPALPRLRVKTYDHEPRDYFSTLGVLYDVAIPRLERMGLFAYWDYANIVFEKGNRNFLIVPWRVGFQSNPDHRSLANENNLPRTLCTFLRTSSETLLSLAHTNVAAAIDRINHYIAEWS